MLSLLEKLMVGGCRLTVEAWWRNTSFSCCGKSAGYAETVLKRQSVSLVAFTRRLLGEAHVKGSAYVSEGETVHLQTQDISRRY